ncbi:MAG TPA: radical SAM protein [Chitinophagales bacterium]|jgi:radical SAM superfamily enzyme YgiQ (UPF0313 family)|nr:radical SAM protein [Chitinophagales bacterium]
MKILFIGLGSEQLGISILTSILKREGHDVQLVFTASLFHDRFNLEIPWLSKYFDETKEIIDEIIEHQPDVIAFSCLTATFQWAIAIAKGTRAIHPNIKTIFGGVHVSAVPEVCLEYPEVDYAVVGEGDVAITDIIKNIEEGVVDQPINNTQFKATDGSIIKGKQVGFYQDLDELPFPDKTIWEPHVNLRDNYLIMASRGCPYTCSFCFNNFFAKLPDGKRGKFVRQRSVDNVIKELKWAKERYKIKTVKFEDDVFTVNKAWIIEFCKKYKAEIDLPFNCLIHPQYFDEEIAEMMSIAGVNWIQMGIQTMDENFKHQNLRRYEESNHIIKALELIEKYNIKIKVDIMLGLPGESITSQETTLKLFKKHTPKRIQTFWTSFLPGTDMFKKAVADGTVSKEKEHDLVHGIDFYFYRNKDNIKELQLAKQYINYEFIYKILPLLPNYFKQRIEAKSVARIPKFIKVNLGTLMDMFNGLQSLNTDFIYYGNFYIQNLIKFTLRRFGYNSYKITKANNKVLSINNETNKTSKTTTPTESLTH